MTRSVRPPAGKVRVIVNVDPSVWRAYRIAAAAAGYESASHAIRDHLAAGPTPTGRPTKPAAVRPTRHPARKASR